MSGCSGKSIQNKTMIYLSCYALHITLVVGSQQLIKRIRYERERYSDCVVAGLLWTVQLCQCRSVWGGGLYVAVEMGDDRWSIEDSIDDSSFNDSSSKTTAASTTTASTQRQQLQRQQLQR
ncbi:hypothetical protein VE01_10736 [Pseudogymnoascus verrucosus]|uniref:Uncharacterized protein n=1 Tax=Pseudogymnoascus verrucosus TaxID=342668 RepID=A0A2P6FGS3_9PEZI|nr:uncharacterized protein VE01_10736 [Pseudogymnoascus verrucosus]PQM43840.1 hypothetical protein VE01_10736 [Pseudogymnoascus verrucosus]